MKRSLAATAALALSVLLVGCSTDDDPAGGSDAPSRTSTAAGGTDREVENETYARGADVATFCGVLEEINNAIDDAGAGGGPQWKRIGASFDALDASGVPDDFPEDAVTALVHLELLVRESTSVPDFYDALRKTPAETSAVDDYVSSTCGP